MDELKKFIWREQKMGHGRLSLFAAAENPYPTYPTVHMSHVAHQCKPRETSTIYSLLVLCTIVSLAELCILDKYSY